MLRDPGQLLAERNRIISPAVPVAFGLISLLALGLSARNESPVDGSPTLPRQAEELHFATVHNDSTQKASAWLFGQSVAPPNHFETFTTTTTTTNNTFVHYVVPKQYLSAQEPAHVPLAQATKISNWVAKALPTATLEQVSVSPAVQKLFPASIFIEAKTTDCIGITHFAYLDGGKRIWLQNWLDGYKRYVTDYTNLNNIVMVGVVDGDTDAESILDAPSSRDPFATIPQVMKAIGAITTNTCSGLPPQYKTSSAKEN